MTLDPDSGEVVPDGLTSPFPDSGETALDHGAQATGRLAVQYQHSPRMLALIAAHAADAQRIENCLVSIPPLDDPTLAPYSTPDSNLDVTGKLVGIDRVLSDGTVPNDTTFRVYIAMQIARNVSIGSDPQFIAALEKIFGSTPGTFRYYSLGRMTIFIEVASGTKPSSDDIALLDNGPVPRAMGVGVNRTWYDGTDYFGFLSDTRTGRRGFGLKSNHAIGGKFGMKF